MLKINVPGIPVIPGVLYILFLNSLQENNYEHCYAHNIIVQNVTEQYGG